MSQGIIAVTLIPGWPIPVAGSREQLEVALHDGGFVGHTIRPDGLFVGDTVTATSFLSTYVGSASELSFNKTTKQTALDALLLGNFNLISFIMAGNATPITATQIGTFLATITTNYRTLRANIAAATTVAQVNAININQGWPSNP